MRNSGTVKTGSARKHLLLLGVGIAALAGIVILAVLLWYRSPAPAPVLLPVRTYTLTVPLQDAAARSRVYHLAGAYTLQQQQIGLGNVPSMPADQGMVFVYTSTANRCFWMKDMRFAIDMIWVDGSKTVTAIEPALNPSTYPKTYCHTGMYVIELNAGEAARSHLQIGQKLTF